MLLIILAGLLSLPAMLLLAVTAIVVAVLSIPAISLLLFRKQRLQRQEKKGGDASSSSINGDTTHVIVTGGSSGIGLAIACEAAADAVDKKKKQKNTSTKITIVARNEKRLDDAKAAILGVNTDVEVQAISVVRGVLLFVERTLSEYILSKQIVARQQARTLRGYILILLLVPILLLLQTEKR